MKTLKFASDLVPLVTSLEKTVTWRVFDDKDLQVGDELEFVNKDTGEKFGNATIKEVREKKLGDIDEKDFVGHEKYPGREAMFAEYKKYYGEKVTEDSVVKIISFVFRP